MGFLAGVLGLVGLLCWLVALLGLISPKIFTDQKTGVVPTRGALFGGGAVAGVVAIVIAALVNPDATPEAAVADSSAPAVVANVESKKEEAKPEAEMETEQNLADATKSLKVTPEQFRQSYNQLVHQIDPDFKLPTLKVKSGAVNDTFLHTVAPNVSLVGTVHKETGQLKDLMILVGGSGDEQADHLKPVIVLLTASQVLNTAVTKEENSKLVTQMATQAMENMDSGTPIERTLGQLTYTVSASKLTGLMFAISPI